MNVLSHLGCDKVFDYFENLRYPLWKLSRKSSE